MRRLASIVAILLLLASGAPVMACLTNVVMSHEESACCRAMHGQCGHMQKMGCCQTEVRTDETPQIGATSPTIHIQWIYVGHTPSLSIQAHSTASIVRHPPNDQIGRAHV